MKIKSTLALLLACALGTGAALHAAGAGGTTANPADLAALKAPAGSKQWPAATPLFTPDLANAATATAGAWSCKDGVFTGKGIAWTKAAYDNFYLSLEFRAQAKADGGLFFRCSDTKDHGQNSIEIQLLQGDHPSNSERALVGALYDLAKPSRQIEIEPGQWYRLLVSAENDRITVYLNDERLVRADLNKWTTPRKNPDGTGNKFTRPIAAFARSGVIGLHAAGGRIEFRNLFIDSAPPPPPAPPPPAAPAVAPAGADARALVAYVTATPWTGKIGKDQLTSTITLHPDFTYTENWRGKDKRGTWRVTDPATITLKSPENTTLVFTADPANRVLRRRGSAIYTPTNPAALENFPAAGGARPPGAPSANATAVPNAGTAAALFANVTYLPPSTPAAETEDWTTQVPVITVPAATGIPSDATVLFDGAGLDAWESTSAKEDKPLWKIAGGVLTPVDKTGSLRTKTAHGDVQLHLEFRTQTNPAKNGQARGNSGLLFMGLYEFQILDSHENPTYANGQAASIYKQHPPLVNASRPPGEWQTCDVIFIAPRFAADGALLSPARITAFHNGALVQHDAILTGPTGHRGRLAYAMHPAKLPLMLQNHATDRPSFRNIWLRDLAQPTPATAPAAAK